jgi:hypothetical protein
MEIREVVGALDTDQLFDGRDHIILTMFLLSQHEEK